MKRPVVLAIVALLAAVAVYLLVIRGDDDAGTGETAAPAQPERQAPPPSRAAVSPARDDAPAPAVRDSPTSDTPIYRTREDGSVVRDHRKNADPNVEWVRPALPHPSRSPVDASVTTAVMRQVRPVVLECLRKVPDSAYGAAPAVVTRALIAIDDHGKLTFVELGPAVADIEPAAAADALACIRDAAPTLSAQVDHAAVPAATLAFTIRPRGDRP